MSSTDPSAQERDIEKLTLILGGHICFQTVSAAVQLDLFTTLSRSGPLSRSDIASRLGVAEKPVRILLSGCTSLGLLQKQDALYSNSPVAQAMLTSDSPANVLAIVKWQHFINYRAMYFFYDAILANKNVGLSIFEGSEPTLYERLAHTPELETIFQDAMQTISRERNVNAALAAAVDFSPYEHLVDVGGGNAENIITLARKYPALRASVFDSPSVCHIAKANIQAAGLSGQLDTIVGNCFTDPFPQGFDCMLFCHFFTIWSEEQNLAILRKCYTSLPTGGSVVVFNMMQHDDETGPLRATLGSPYFLTLATGVGMLYTWSEYKAWMKEAGFATVTTKVLPNHHGVIIGTKG